MSSNLGIALEKAGITRIVLVRHANAAPWGQDLPKKGAEGYPIHSWQRDDQMRPLTDKGKQQAAVAREWFLRDISLAANKMIITSGAQRASQTAQVFIEQQVKKKGMLSGLFCTGAADVRECTMNIAGSLHPAGIAPKCEELFDTHGYAPLGCLRFSPFPAAASPAHFPVMHALPRAKNAQHMHLYDSHVTHIIYFNIIYFNFS